MTTKGKNWFRNNGLSIVLAGLFLVTLGGQTLAGWLNENEERRTHGQAGQPLLTYLADPAYAESVFENWESEFLQMGLYVLLTVFFFQKGSSESKDPNKKEDVDAEPDPRDPQAPWAVRYGTLTRKIYSHSLSIAFLLLFLLSFLGHWWSGAKAHNEERILHGQQPLPLADYFVSSRFWFESLQNWQSEFLAVLSIVLLSVWLREKGSPESKPVDSPNDSTGE